MKTTLCFTLILTTFAMLVFVPNSLAQDDSPEYVVRVIYFLPNNRTPHPEIDTELDTLMKKVQEFYADEMERHGFGRKTFRLESNENGDTLVHHVKGRHDDAHYIKNTLSVLEETADEFDTSENIYFYAVDISSKVLPGSACGYGNDETGGGFAMLPASGDCFVGYNGFTGAAHELGHAFGSHHDFRNDSYIMAYSLYRNELSACHAEWLNAHRYFNAAPTPTLNSNTRIEMLPPEISRPYAIRLRFQISDPDGLHQAQLLTLDIGDPILLDCKSLSGDNNTVEFTTTELVEAYSEKGNLQIILHVMDIYGNLKWQSFETHIDFPFPQDEVVSIPDASLAAAVRESLELAPNSPITQLDMLKLTKLNAEGQEITDLTGLEHAKRLKFVHLSHNQITNIAPLTELIQLTGLYLTTNQITDISSLTKLPQLTRLHLSFNPIQDLTPLSEMKQVKYLELLELQINDASLFAPLTQLLKLDLRSNQITDIMPLTGLKQLIGLNLGANPIQDLAPLVEMTQLDDLGIHGLQIKDISFLSDWTQLTSLYLGDNQIRDITPLKDLKWLVFLDLSNNQISDVRPLSGLVNLRQLWIVGNPIKNRTPLLELLRKNPDVKIYLEYGGEPLPVTLSYFRAEHTNAGVVLKWTTESEVDNAGFFIYRSETKNGEFKIVNPTMIQGAGTIGERNEYTWTDTTAKPNTIYYYRIEDVSHASERKQLATVRLRGLVSASGKLTTRWADLKIQN